MSREVRTITADSTLDEAARIFSQHHISGLCVVDPDGKPLGVVSLADVVDPDRAREGHPMTYQHDDADPPAAAAIARRATIRVTDVMSPFVLSIEADASIVAAARLMLLDDVHRLLVTRAGRIVGIVTTTDLLRGFVGAAT